jgi:hypothetical protein
MADDLEAMGVPVLGDLEEPGLDKLKKEMLFTFISSNPDYDEVIEIDDGEASQLPASRGSQAAPTVTTGGVVGGLLQHIGLDLNSQLLYILRVLILYSSIPVHFQTESESPHSNDAAAISKYALDF